jgi:hypothetical protein
MKTTTLLAALLFFGISVKSQIPNYGFEQLNSDGSIRNWGNVYLWPMYIDSSGSSYVDSLVFDGGFLYGTTTDAHFGQRALELRNAWDFTTNQGISGGVTADNDTMFSAWGSFETIDITNQPFNFSFFYKFLPAGSDTGSATLQLFDSSMNFLGGAEMLLTGTVGNYTQATVPVVWTTPGYAAFAYIHFSTAIYGTTPTFGTRLLVDDVMFNYASATGIQEVNAEGMQVYPNPATDRIEIHLDHPVASLDVEILNTLGQIVSSTKNKQVNISDLPSGIYIARVITTGKVFLTKWIKE